MSLTAEQNFGDYRVCRRLGRGGMGEVYEVESPAGKRYALKVFSSVVKNREFLAKRFRVEAKLLAGLDHPGLVKVHDAGEIGDSPYFTMDLVLNALGEPETLEDARLRGGVSQEQAMRWFRELADALAYLHDRGIVHRDVKLENVLVDAHGHVVLSDFGISRIFSEELRQELNVTQTFIDGQTTGTRPVMGTYFYIPPEVRAGAAAGPDADFYALGVVFFRLLTGIWYEPGLNAGDLLSPFGEFWRKTLPPLLACEDGGANRAKAARNEARRRRLRQRLAWCASGAVLGLALAAAAVFPKNRDVPHKRLPKPSTPGVLWMDSLEDLRGVDIGTVTSLVVRPAMGNIHANQFNGWPALRQVEVCEGVEVLHSAAFFGCARLEQVVLPNTLKAIGSYAFGDCFALRSVRCGSGLRDVGQAAFGGCTNLVDVYFGGDVPAALGTRIYVRTPTNLVNHVKSNAKGWGETWPPNDSSTRHVVADYPLTTTH